MPLGQSRIEEWNGSLHFELKMLKQSKDDSERKVADGRYSTSDENHDRRAKTSIYEDEMG